MVLTHASGGGGDVQVAMLVEAGVAPNRLLIGHVDHKDVSPRHLRRIARTGASLGFDRAGAVDFLSDAMRAGLVAGAIADGLADRLTLSMDTAVHWYGGGPLIADHRPVPFEHLTDEFLPLLARFGVAAETIDRILVATPRRLLAGEPS